MLRRPGIIGRRSKLDKKWLGKPFGQHGVCAKCGEHHSFDHLLKVNRGEYKDKDLCEPCFSIAKKAEAQLEEPAEMYLCETEQLMLKPQLYRFLVHPDCARCKEMEVEGDPGR